MLNYKTVLLLGAAILLTCSSCFKRPEAVFSYHPVKNPEAGDEIVFTNESLDALYYYWDFGNGKTSEKENPTIVFDKPGDYTVTLVAENKFRSSSIEQTLLINPPTIVDIYCYGSKGGPLVSGWMRVWRSYENAVQGEAPLQSCITDAYGKARFKNLDARTYFVYLRKEVEGGIYEGGGDIGPLVLNEINVYSALINHFPGKKSELKDESGTEPTAPVPFQQLDKGVVSK